MIDNYVNNQKSKTPKSKIYKTFRESRKTKRAKQAAKLIITIYELAKNVGESIPSMILFEQWRYKIEQHDLRYKRYHNFHFNYTNIIKLS